MSKETLDMQTHFKMYNAENTYIINYSYSWKNCIRCRRINQIIIINNPTMYYVCKITLETFSKANVDKMRPTLSFTLEYHHMEDKGAHAV